MKIFVLLLAILIFPFNSVHASYQLTGESLAMASESALLEALAEVNEDSIFAWESKASQEGFIVKILNEDGFLLLYNCQYQYNQYNEKQMSCQMKSNNQGAQHYHKDPSIALDFIKAGHQVALKKFKNTIRRRRAREDLTVKTTSLKVWVHQDNHKEDAHGHGPDIWTKINFNLNNTRRIIFILCHFHGHGTNFICHYRRSGQGEPNLSS